MRQRCNLSWRKAGVKPNNLQVTDPRSAERFWRDQPSSSGIASIRSQPSQDPPPRVDSDFMSIDAAGMYPILACSWRQAQQPSGIRFRIGVVVVVEYYAGWLGI